MDSMTESGGRVTRALRKRLTSIDSDNGSSRPGTPVISKLSAPSTCSPMKVRMARRHSTSGVGTPVKTPGKRVANGVAAIAEEANITPARRTTRRRSISQIENEPTPKQEKSGANFESLEEEPVTERITRSKSKSPEQAKSIRGRRSIVRSKDDVKAVAAKDKSDSEKENLNDKKVKQELMPTSTSKRKSIATDGDKKLPKNQTSELENGLALEKRNEISLSITEKKKTAESLEIVNPVDSVAAHVISDAAETNDNGVKNITSDKCPKSDDVELLEEENVIENEKNGKDTADKSNASSEMQSSVEATISQHPEIEKTDQLMSPDKEVDGHPTPLPELSYKLENKNVEVTEDNSKSNAAIQKRDSFAAAIVKPDQKEEVDQLMPKTKEVDVKPIEMRRNSTCSSEEDISLLVYETASPKRKSDQEDESPMNFLPPVIEINDNKAQEDQNVEDDVENSKSDKTNTQSQTTRLINGNITENIEASPGKHNNVEEECETVEDADLNTGNKEDEEIELKSRTSSPSSPNKTSNLNTENVVTTFTTPARNTSSIKPNAGSEADLMKKVAFSPNVSDDESEKSIYPKTPASAKSKCLIEKPISVDCDTSFESTCINNDSVIVINDTTEVEPDTQVKEIMSSKNETIADSDIVVTNENNALDVTEEVIGDVSQSATHDDTKLKWCKPSVVSNSSKLDAVENCKEQIVNKSALDESISTQKKKRTFIKRNEWNEDDGSSCEEDEELVEEDEEEEEKYKRKHQFHDDEAVEVDDYESGDSMESEERREIIENEIPLDEESLGSHSSDEEENDDEESENDSFIVSDDDDEEDMLDHSRSESEEEIEKELNESENTKKKKYKRIQRVLKTSSSEDDEPSYKSECKNNSMKVANDSDAKLNLSHSKTTNTDKKCNANITGQTDSKKLSEDPSPDKNDSKEADENCKIQTGKTLNNSRLSDSAMRLQSDLEDESDNSGEEDDINKSRKELLRKLNQSDRFNKSVRDLNTEVEVSPDAMTTSNDNGCGGVSPEDTNTSKNRENLTDSEGEIKPTSTSRDVNDPELIEMKLVIEQKSSSSKHTESHLGEVSVTSDENTESDEDSDDERGEDSDDEKENLMKTQSKVAQNRRGLSVSFGNSQQQKTGNCLHKKVLQRSFTIGVSINGDELETEIIKSKPTKFTTSIPLDSSPSASLSSNEDTDGHDVLSSDDARYLENVKHIPLGKPLVRTRRQSLALPANPDMEIGSAQQDGLKGKKRRSLAILAGNEFNPSQSFADTLELRKAELEQQSCKRKRLSKSFSGTTADNSVVDIDVRHLHKRSKYASENSFAESLENSKPDNSMCLKAVGHSSTPHDKGCDRKQNNSGIRRILNRCDEILEAANRAKLEAKLNQRKCKVRPPRKNKKKPPTVQSSSPDAKSDNDKAKHAVTQALMASANIIIGKRRKQLIQENSEVSNRQSADILNKITVNTPSTATASKNKKEKHAEESSESRTYPTAAGNFVETLQSPQRKKKSKIIRLPTGNVCVEPLTPAKRSILSCKGMKFYESPLTPCAVGFKVREACSSNGSNGHNNMDRKRKRNEDARESKLPTPQWTQSGLFIEEEIISARPPHAIKRGRITKRAHLEQVRGKNTNYKEIALLRGDVKRSTGREFLQLQERRQRRGHPC